MDLQIDTSNILTALWTSKILHDELVSWVNLDMAAMIDFGLSGRLPLIDLGLSGSSQGIDRLRSVR